MNQGTFSATMIRLGPSKKIFVFRPKIGSFSRGKSMVFGPKLPNFEVGIFHLFKSLQISASR